MDREYNRFGHDWLYEPSDAARIPIHDIKEDNEEDEFIEIIDDRLEWAANDGLNLLEYEIKNNDRDEVDGDKTSDGDREGQDQGDRQGAGGGSGGIRWGRAGKLAIAVCALVAIGVVPTMRLVASESAQAIVNARVVTIRAPIEGELWWSAAFRIGTTVTRGDVMLVINNQRAESPALDSIRRDLFRLNAEKDTLLGRIKTARRERISLLAADQVHRSARLKQFRFRKDQVLAQIQVAKANEANAGSSLKRTSWLADRGLSTRALLESKSRDSEVASRSVEVLEHQLQQIDVEFDAALKGIRLTDDHNTLTHMKARAQQLSFEINALELQLGSLDKHITLLNEDLEKEEQRFSEKQRTLVSSPSDGRVWEVLGSSGELVQRGQPLFRLLDCTGALISTSVSEATYNRLRVGGPAVFRSSSDFAEYTGNIVTMHGLAAPPANLAIEPSYLRNEPFRVGVFSPALATLSKCTVGQTGIVRFDAEGGFGVVKRVRHWLDYWIQLS